MTGESRGLRTRAACAATENVVPTALGEAVTSRRAPARASVGGCALVAYGDVTDVATWSGTPYFFLDAGLRAGLFRTGVSLHPERARIRRLAWNAARPLVFEHPGGFRYSRRHLAELWGNRRPSIDGVEYVSHFPLLPPTNEVGSASYYIDATLSQYFREYGHTVGRRIKVDAIARERDAYQAARFVICMSKWCADEVMSSYDVPAERVVVITPGANVHEPIEFLPDWDARLAPLRLGFVGREWDRKGGPLLLATATTLERMGFAVEVVVIGPDPSEVPSHHAVRALGFIDKAHDHSRFLDVVRSFHFGCLLSRVEALGISLLECLRLGVPVLGTAVGGMAEIIPDDAGILFSPEDTSDRIAEELADVARTPERYGNMRAAAEKAAARYTWSRAAEEVQTLFER